MYSGYRTCRQASQNQQIPKFSSHWSAKQNSIYCAVDRKCEGRHREATSEFKESLMTFVPITFVSQKGRQSLRSNPSRNCTAALWLLSVSVAYLKGLSEFVDILKRSVTSWHDRVTAEIPSTTTGLEAPRHD